jgi:hypothetical protein
MAIAATIFLMLALALVATAADPIIGSWKLNVAKSYFTDKQWIPKEKTEVLSRVESGADRIDR